MAHFHFESDGVAMGFSVYDHPIGILNDFGCSIVYWFWWYFSVRF